MSLDLPANNTHTEYSLLARTFSAILGDINKNDKEILINIFQNRKRSGKGEDLSKKELLVLHKHKLLPAEFEMDRGWPWGDPLSQLTKDWDTLPPPRIFSSNWDVGDYENMTTERQQSETLRRVRTHVVVGLCNKLDKRILSVITQLGLARQMSNNLAVWTCFSRGGLRGLLWLIKIGAISPGGQLDTIKRFSALTESIKKYHTWWDGHIPGHFMDYIDLKTLNGYFDSEMKEETKFDRGKGASELVNSSVNKIFYDKDGVGSERGFMDIFEEECHAVTERIYLKQRGFQNFQEMLDSGYGSSQGAWSKEKISTTGGKKLRVSKAVVVATKQLEFNDVLQKATGTETVITKDETGKARTAVSADGYQSMLGFMLTSVLKNALKPFKQILINEDWRGAFLRQEQIMQYLAAGFFSSPLDYMGYDTQLTKEEELTMKKIVWGGALERSGVSQDTWSAYHRVMELRHAAALELSLSDFKYTMLPEGAIVKGSRVLLPAKGGLLSGVPWTSIEGSLLNYIYVRCVWRQLLSMCPGLVEPRLPEYMKGDDLLHFFPNWQVGILWNICFAGMGLRAAKEKQTDGWDWAELLRVDYTSKYAASPVARVIGSSSERKPVGTDPQNIFAEIETAWVGMSTLGRRSGNYDAALILFKDILRDICSFWNVSYQEVELYCSTAREMGGAGMLDARRDIIITRTGGPPPRRSRKYVTEFNREVGKLSKFDFSDDVVAAVAQDRLDSILEGVIDRVWLADRRDENRVLLAKHGLMRYRSVPSGAWEIKNVSHIVHVDEVMNTKPSAILMSYGWAIRNVELWELEKKNYEINNRGNWKAGKFLRFLIEKYELYDLSNIVGAMPYSVVESLLKGSIQMSFPRFDGLGGEAGNLQRAWVELIVIANIRGVSTRKSHSDFAALVSGVVEWVGRQLEPIKARFERT